MKKQNSTETTPNGAAAEQTPGEALADAQQRMEKAREDGVGYRFISRAFGSISVISLAAGAYGFREATHAVGAASGGNVWGDVIGGSVACLASLVCGIAASINSDNARAAEQTAGAIQTAIETQQLLQEEMRLVREEIRQATKEAMGEISLVEPRREAPPQA